MKRKYWFLTVLIIPIVLGGCNTPGPVITDETSYIKSIEEWQKSRVMRLKAENGWLNLAGLFWLKEGENSFGSDPSNDIVFPEKADGLCGIITLDDGKVTLSAEKDASIESNGIAVTTLILNDDHSDNRTDLRQGDLLWYIIKRGEKYGIRLKDLNHPRIDMLEHIPSYPISTPYVVEAILVPFDEPRKMVVATPVEGFTEEYECPGKLLFRIDKKKLELYPFTSDEGFFLVFADETTGVETYGAGRFLYSSPDSTGRIILDFNRAYNPPCAFSPFATCPMPPKENFLPVAIEAGEKSVHFE